VGRGFPNPYIYRPQGALITESFLPRAQLVALLQESLAVATRTEVMRPKDLVRVIIDHSSAQGG
jgi:hypothetical protein